MTSFSVSLKKIIDELSLEVLNMPKDASEIMVTSMDLNRPGLCLDGYFEFFDATRLQLIGKAEEGFLSQLTSEVCAERLDTFFSYKPCAVIVARNLPVSDDMLNSAKKYEVPLLRTPEATSAFSSTLISFLSVELAPRITRHGVLVEVYGEGILLLGESGVGKSETAIELVKRGHRLIADDAVEIRRVSSKTLVGSSPENIRHFIELRGVGIINARRIFGIGSVKITEKIDMVVQLELWDKNKVYDRMGIENEYMEILGNKVPTTTIPVKPGRNLAIIIEVAAMNNRQKKMGYNSAQELLNRLGMTDEDSNIGWDDV